MTAVSHPTPETLAAFARCDLTPAELAAVAEHVGGCAACRASLVNVPSDATNGLARAAEALEAPAVTATVTKPDTIPHGLIDHPRYRVLGELGAGGMGVVYKAEHRIMDRVVALKVLAPHLTSRRGAAERFGKEVRAASKLNHPNIVTVFDADEANGALFLAMEYVEGTSLDRMVAKKGPLPVPMACQFARQAALGLQHASEKGMVHRDIKPQNLMVTRKGHLKVLDFGLARFARNDVEEESPLGRLPFGAGKPVADPLTNPNLLMGTPDYLSPEQAKNSHAVDSRSDIYSLGCTFFFLLTGRPPFSHAPSLIDKLLAHTEEAPPAIRTFRPEVPPALAATLAKMLAKNPDDRFGTAGEVATALHPFTKTSDPPMELPEAVPTVPLPPASKRAPAKSPTETDTSPPNANATLTERARPRRAKKSRRSKALPWWKTTWAKLGAVAVLVLVVATIAGRGKKPVAPPGDTANNGTPPSTNSGPPPSKVTPNPFRDPEKPQRGKDLKVLFVLPSEGLWLPDYLPVRKRLEEDGVKVVTAGVADVSKFHLGADSGAGGNRTPVPIDLKLTAELDVSPYSAVIFCGENTREFVGFSASSFAAAQVIRRMQHAEKVVSGICLGEKVLIMHGAVTNKKASRHEKIVENLPPNLPMSGKITWVDSPVVTDGKVVTAADPRNAVPFAEELLKVMLGE